MNTLDTALMLRAAGVATIPVGPDKVPFYSWKKWQTEVPPEDLCRQWFCNGANIAIVAGSVQCLDIDTKHAPDGAGLWDRYQKRCRDFGLAGLLDRVLVQRTVSGGIHLVFRCAAHLGNVKLAENPDQDSLLETRGQGGYFLIAPSAGYTLIQGNWSNLPELSADDRDSLLAVARSFNERAPKEVQPATAATDAAPGTDYDARADVPALLQAHGWAPVGGSTKYWTRPGKTQGVSASWDVIPGRFWVFSTSTAFEAQHVYRPWHVFAVLECGGDFKEAARRLGKLGYGTSRSMPKLSVSRAAVANHSDDPPAAEPNPTPALVDLIEARRFNLDCPPPTPEPRYWIAGVGISTSGNLTAVCAMVKAGKSSFIGGMIAAAITERPEEVDCLGVASRNPEGKALIHIDTEQSPYDHHDLIRRVLRRAKLERPPAWLRSYCLTGFNAIECRRALELTLERAAEQFGGIHSVIIDGVADLVINVNDPEEANPFVAELHALAIRFECPLIAVIHINPGTEKTRGHLGSQLERKAETNLRLDKDEEVTVVWSDKNRRAPIPRDQGPRFQWSAAAGMHLQVASLSVERDANRRQELQDLAEAVLGEAKKPCLAWKEWVQMIMQTAHIPSARTAEKRFNAMRKLGVLEKNAFGQWKLQEHPTP